ncbi:CHC2 zinc finger domain-containing protein [Metabacillus fastidiosus]|uniref:CHC2 zinc finger domain-containing protein n=1 Tax=Metabacillus fastidiosus TaxID=1458 RepID=UPI003D2D485B
MEKTQRKRISQETLDIINSIPILDLANVLGDHPKRVGKQYQIYCPNPDHHENTSDSYIEPNKNLFKCFGGGGCGAGGSNAFSYYYWHEYGRAYDKTNKEDRKNFPLVVTKIADLMGIQIQYDDGSYVQPSGTTSYVPRNPQPKELEPQSIKICDAVYRAFLSLCPVYKEHGLEWLQERKYSKEDITTIGLRSVPAEETLYSILKELIARSYPLDRVPGFSQRLIPDNIAAQYPAELIEKDNEGRGYWLWTISASKGYFIPVRDHNGYIVRLRVRRDEGNPKYIWFSSQDNTAIEKEKYRLRRNGVSSGAPINVVPPVSQIKTWEVGTDLSAIYKVDVVVATEGEHSAKRYSISA